MSGRLKDDNTEVFYCSRCGHSHARTRYGNGIRLYDATASCCDQVIEVVRLAAWRRAIVRHNLDHLTPAGRAALQQKGDADGR